MAHGVDINSATAEDLDKIPQLNGHGFEIVRYRGEHGRFTELRQLEEVPAMAGQTEGLEATLYICVTNRRRPPRMSAPPFVSSQKCAIQILGQASRTSSQMSA